jgi:cytochrome c nitrite reductase small subunit
MGEDRRIRAWLRTGRGKLSLFAAGGVVVGVIVGGLSAALLESTDSPEFCSTCHIMDSAFGSFTESNHALLDCNDCHAPAKPWLLKMTFKARAGAGHMYMNTIGRGEIPDVLHATSETAEVVNENCIRCHAPSQVLISHDAKENCADCHRSVPHGRGMFRPDEWHEPIHPDVPDREVTAAQP